MRIEMPADAEWIIDSLRRRGFEAFAVGGCVRDAVLGREPEDWDIATSAKPGDVKLVFGKTVDTGLAHGTVTVLKNGRGYEVTTYRIDGEYLDGRHPESVSFTSDLREDLKRRDFTVNAMAYSHETGIVDLFGGLEDLENRIVRCVGSPRERFTEDALRILRAVRFLAQLDFTIDPDTLAAMRELAPTLACVSRERVQAELTKLLLSDHPDRMELVKSTGISRYVTEGFDETFSGDLDENGAAGRGGEPPAARLRLLPADKTLRWAGFLRHETAENAKRILRGLKLDNKTICDAKAMIEGYHSHIPADKTEIRRILSRMTDRQFDGALLLKELERWPEAEAVRGLIREIRDSGDCVGLKNLAIKGDDLIQYGMKPGPGMGEALHALLELVLEHPEWNEREILLQKLRERDI